MAWKYDVVERNHNPQPSTCSSIFCVELWTQQNTGATTKCLPICFMGNLSWTIELEGVQAWVFTAGMGIY